MKLKIDITICPKGVSFCATNFATGTTFSANHMTDTESLKFGTLDFGVHIIRNSPALIHPVTDVFLAALAVSNTLAWTEDRAVAENDLRIAMSVLMVAIAQDAEEQADADEAADKVFNAIAHAVSEILGRTVTDFKIHPELGPRLSNLVNELIDQVYMEGECQCYSCVEEGEEGFIYTGEPSEDRLVLLHEVLTEEDYLRIVAPPKVIKVPLKPAAGKIHQSLFEQLLLGGMACAFMDKEGNLTTGGETFSPSDIFNPEEVADAIVRGIQGHFRGC